MIAAHQPTIFPSHIRVFVSSVENGDIKYWPHVDSRQAEANRQNMLREAGFDFEQTNIVRVTFDGDDYCRYGVAQKKDAGIGPVSARNITPHDALSTKMPGRGLYLPLADCCAVAFADTKQNVIMLSHMGRHSTEQSGAIKTIAYLQEHYQSNVEDIVVWLSPAAGKDNFPIYALDGNGLHESIIQQLLSTGVLRENIEVSDVDTTTDERYFSHSEFLKGHRETDGRFAVGMMIEP